MAEPLDPDHPVARRLGPDENVRAHIAIAAAKIVVTDRRLAVAEDQRLAFDIERNRPATLVIVPDHPLHEPQVLAVPPEQLRAVAEALAYIGQRLNPEGSSSNS